MLLEALPTHIQTCRARSAKLHTQPKRLGDVFSVRKGHPELYSVCIWLAGYPDLAWHSALLL